MTTTAIDSTRASARTRFRVRELPREQSVMRFICENSDFAAARERVAPAPPVRGLLAFPLGDSLLEGMRAAARQAIEAHGVHGWLTREGRSSGDPYISLSLTYNPDLDDPEVRDVHQATLGSSLMPRKEFYYSATEYFDNIKNTYFDTYGFRFRTPAAQIGALGEFLSGCRLSLVRSRLSVLKGEYGAICPFRFGWHRDESVFENLRINIPLFTEESFRLQLEHELDQPDESSPTMSQYHLAAGAAYTFDTNRPHRVFPAAPSQLDRVHLVLGFSPWLRYDAQEDAWEPNEYYGKVHPFDIVRSGGLHPLLKAA